MMVHSFRAEYLSVINAFLRGEIDVDRFCNEFTDIWIKDRDQIYARSQDWPEPHDQILKAALAHGEITPEQFEQEYGQIWIYPDGLAFRLSMDSIHSACSIYNDVPTKNWQIDASGLREEIKRSIATANSD